MRVVDPLHLAIRQKQIAIAVGQKTISQLEKCFIVGRQVGNEIGSILSGTFGISFSVVIGRCHSCPGQNGGGHGHRIQIHDSCSIGVTMRVIIGCIDKGFIVAGEDGTAHGALR